MTTLAELPEDEFRAAVREVLRTKGPGKPPRDPAGRLAWRREWQGVLFDQGLAGPGWPRVYGGMELPFPLQVAYQDELIRARVPGAVGNGPTMAGPTIIKYGTDEQRARFLRPMLRNDEVWAQGFSEPGAGSDLPSLRTAARREGDVYLVNGQKVWSTYANVSDWAFVLVRTGTQADRQNGISYLLIDMTSPGITVRPLRDLTGAHDFCEIFFDDVAVPVAQRVGEENGGWRVARTTLGHERSAGALNQASFYRRVTDELLALARERGLTDSPVVRRRLADLDARVRVMRINAMRMISDIVAHGEPGPASSVSRLYNSTLEQQLHEIAVEVLGAPAVLLGDDPDAVQRGRWTYGFLRTRASTIGAGTAEIQRNTIAEQVLRLPHDPAMPPRVGS